MNNSPQTTAAAAPERTATARPTPNHRNQRLNYDSTGVPARQSPNRMVAHALRYGMAGLAVFPCNGKVPLTGRGHLDATTDLETIAAWWRRWPSANIGLPMAPNGLIAIDVDPRHGGTLAALDLPADLKTWRAATGGGGQHIIFAAPAGVDDVPATLGPGIDVKFNGYVIADPSVHPDTGKVYHWLPNQSPWDIDQPAQVPAALLERMTRQAAPQAAKPAICDHKPAQARTEGATVPLDVVEDALRSIGPWDGGYFWWLSMLMAIHSEHPDADGLAMAEKWADGNPGEHGKPSEVSRKWAGFDASGGVGIGTLLREAKKRGWIDPRRNSIDDETDVPEYWRITDDDWHACPICEPLYVQRFSDGSVRSHHKWCRRAICPVWRKVKARKALGPAVGWAGVRYETVPAEDWRAFRETARAALGNHWLGIPQADGSMLAVYESADGETLEAVLQVAAAALLAMPRGKNARKISRPRRDRTRQAEPVPTEPVKPRPKAVERLAVVNWKQCRRLVNALDALAIPWTQRNHGAWETEPLTEPQTIAVRAAVALLRLNAHLGTTPIQAQSDKPQAPATGVFLTPKEARVHELRHDRREIRTERVPLW